MAEGRSTRREIGKKGKWICKGFSEGETFALRLEGWVVTGLGRGGVEAGGHCRPRGLKDVGWESAGLQGLPAGRL